MLGTAMAGTSGSSFTGIGSGAREWGPIDYAVKSIRIHLSDRKTITTVKQFKKAIKAVAKKSDFKKKDLRVAVNRQLHNSYTPDELRKDMTPALEFALSSDS